MHDSCVSLMSKTQPRGHSASQGSDAGLVRIHLTALRAAHSEQASNLRPAAQQARSRHGGCPRGSRLLTALAARECARSRAADGARPALLRQDCGLSRAAPHGTGTFTSGKDSHYQRKGRPSCR
jgi:hypothetical protein